MLPQTTPLLWVCVYRQAVEERVLATLGQPAYTPPPYPFLHLTPSTLSAGNDVRVDRLGLASIANSKVVLFL